MKIEKINDNQIRCTLTHADLAARNLKISETGLWYRESKITISRYDAAGIFRLWISRQMTFL